MTPGYECYLNTKYGRFYLVRYSKKTGNFAQVGKARPTIAEAQRAACDIEARNPDLGMVFLDVVPPQKLL